MRFGANFWGGAVHFRVVDGDVTLLNRLRRFKLSNITVRENVVTFAVALGNRADVVRVLGKREYVARVNGNALRVVNFFYTRAVLVVAAFVAVIGFIICEQFAFRVTVGGNMTPAETVAVRAYLDQIGIRGITAKSRVRDAAVANDIVGHFDFAAFCNISVRSSHIAVTVMRAQNITANIPAGDIVSTVDGVVQNIVVFSGTANVARGDVVRVGDILVTGTRPTAIITVSNGDEVIAIIDNTVVK